MTKSRLKAVLLEWLRHNLDQAASHHWSLIDSGGFVFVGGIKPVSSTSDLSFDVLVVDDSDAPTKTFAVTFCLKMGVPPSVEAAAGLGADLGVIDAETA